MMTEQSILDIVTPPAGYAFDSGVWLTHDISPQAINRWLIPALIGMGTDTTPATVAAAPAALEKNCLTIVAAGDRIGTGAAYPDVVTLIPHADGSRRLHAKVAVLYYVRTNPEAGPASGGLLTLITSANLTRSGLARNREVYAAEWLPSNSGRPCLAIPVLQALRAFKNSMPPGDEKTNLGRRIEHLWKKRHKDATAKPGVLAHSLVDAPPGHAKPLPLHQQLLQSRIDVEAIKRVTLVGPAFADDRADVPKHLAWMLRQGDHVDLIVDTHLSAQEISKHGGRVSVPTGLLTGLRARVGDDNVSVFASACDDASGATRRLHGKSITVHTDGGDFSVVGSANLTVRGLTGRTREMVVLVDHQGPHDAKEALNCVPVAADRIDATTRRDTLPDGVREADVPLLASFFPDPGQHAGVTMLRGTFVVHGRQEGVIELPDGSTIRLTGGQAQIILDPNDLALRWKGSGASRALAIGVYPEDQEFWSNVPLDFKPIAVDPLLALLKQDIARALQTTPTGTTSKGSPQLNDGFHLPLNNRLNVLTRYRGTLESLPPDRLHAILQEFFDDQLEHRVATVVAQAHRGQSEEDKHSLLASLGELIAVTPARGAES